MLRASLFVVLLCLPGCSGLKVTLGAGFNGLSLAIERQRMAHEDAPVAVPAQEVADER